MTAELDQVLDRAPWSTTDGDLTRDMVRIAYAAIKFGPLRASRVAEHLGLQSGGDRRVDRTLQLLRKAGLIRFNAGLWGVP